MTRPVFSRKDGKSHKIYRSISATEKDGFDPSTVSKVLRGDREVHNGCTFHAYRGNVTKLMDCMGKRETITVSVAASNGIRI